MKRARLRVDEHSAGAVVWRRVEGAPAEVLLIRVGTAWSLPKGHVDPGETVEEAALREVAEETGLPPRSLALGPALPPSEYAYRQRDTGRLVFKRVDHHLVELRQPDAPLRAQAGEVDEVAWVPIGEAAGRVAYRDLRAALIEAERLLG